MIKKGNDNPDAWEQIEKDSMSKKQIVIDPNKSVIEDFDEIDDSNVIDVANDDSVEELNPLDEPDNEDYGEVLQLTEYQGGTLTSQSTDFVVAEYEKIDTINIDKAQQLLAKKFIGKVTKFILEFNDIQLTQDHKNYLKQVGQLQLGQLTDMLSLVVINKQMINNIVARVNATQAEDYAIINSYNNLINQHIKLYREVENIYKNIPSVMKKMRADILSNQELEAGDEPDDVITEDFGETQFNSQKQLLKSILAKKDAAKQSSENNKPEN